MCHTRRVCHSPISPIANECRFSHRAKVSEDTALGHVILQVSAQDVDETRHNRNIDYSLASGNEDGMFQIAR